jgi:hypothetical protein
MLECFAMRTVRIDFAAQPEEITVCRTEWSDHQAQLIELIFDIDDAALRKVIPEVDKFRIDVPLGWPVAFVNVIKQLSEHGPWPDFSTEQMRFRRTDYFGTH